MPGNGDAHFVCYGGIKYMDLDVCFALPRIITVQLQESPNYAWQASGLWGNGGQNS